RSQPEHARKDTGQRVLPEGASRGTGVDASCLGRDRARVPHGLHYAQCARATGTPRRSMGRHPRSKNRPGRTPRSEVESRPTLARDAAVQAVLNARLAESRLMGRGPGHAGAHGGHSTRATHLVHERLTELGFAVLQASRPGYDYTPVSVG